MNFASGSLDKKFIHIYTLDEFRNLLGVHPGRYKNFGELNKHVIKPAVDEINALAAFGMSVLPVKQGKRVVEIRVAWWQKDASALRDAWQETQRTRVGRRARIAGTVESVLAPSPSVNRITRQGRKTFSAPKTS